MELNVLVWGPGEGGGEHYAKRVKVKETIAARFPYAEVRFSEELDQEDMVPGEADLRLPEREMWHIAMADLVVVLDTSAGAAAEIAYFANSYFSRKLFILTHEQYRNMPSFPGAIREGLNQIFYNDEEYARCILAERVVTRLRQIALNRLGSLFS